MDDETTLPETCPSEMVSHEVVRCELKPGHRNLHQRDGTYWDESHAKKITWVVA